MRTRVFKRLKICGFGPLLLFALVVIFGGTPRPAAGQEGWWNDQWEYRKKIAFDTTSAGADIADNLDEVPVLVRLHSGNFDFTKAGEAGQDIRFVAGGNDATLKYHIERFDAIDEMAFIWVKVPRLSGAFDRDFIWMYYGNENAADAQNPKGSFDAGQVLVYHFAEIEEAPRDESPYDNHAAKFAFGQGLPAMIGTGAAFTGASDQIIIPGSPSLDFTSGFSFSSWIRVNQTLERGLVFSRREGDRSIQVVINESDLCFEVQLGEDGIYSPGGCAGLTPETWHHVAATYSQGSKIALYLDGVEVAAAGFPNDGPAMNTDLHLGAGPEGSDAFFGDLDEVRIANLARPPGWFQAAYKGQGPDGALLSVGIEEVGGGGGLPIFYLGTIFRNITLDGWVVIGLLILLAVASWLVMLTKSFEFRIMQKDTRRFEAEYARNGNPVSLAGEEGTGYQQSPVYRVYQSGCRELQGIGNVCKADDKEENDVSSPKSSETPLTSRSMDRLRASLDRGYMEESRRLNAGLVMLTLAISGGPFLGLLGTVWGVMNTFAAMAEAGEANIMAIAPGVASALSTTVFGLIVAIPALFGYNFLSAQIKDMASRMVVFIDQFQIKVQEYFGDTP